MVGDLREWVTAIKELNPDVIIFADLDAATILFDLVEESQWDVKGIFVPSITGLKNFDELYSVHWTFLCHYVNFLNQGRTDGTYMGTNEEYIAYATPKIIKYIQDLPSLKEETKIDKEFVALGYLIIYL